MGDDQNVKEKYAAQKRDQKRQVASPAGKQKSVVFVYNEILKEIWIHTDEIRKVGIITFVTQTDKMIRRKLVYTWFPQGIWKVVFQKSPEGAFQATPVSAENVDPALVKRLIEMTKGKEFNLYVFLVEGDYSNDPYVEALYKSALGKEIVVRVTYVASDEKEGKGEALPTRPLSDEYIDGLKVEPLARIYLLMLEHFAGIHIDERVALGGIDKKEYADIVKIPSNNPDLDASAIARIVTRAWHEYVAAGGDSWECLTLMIETLLYQRKCKNRLAQSNQLEISKGLLRQTNGGYKGDIGIKARGGSVLLLYDKYGNAVPAYVGFMDIHYRNIELDKVPSIQVSISDPGLAQLMKVLEQTFSFPVRDVYVLCSSMMKFYVFIVNEIDRLYGHEIRDKVYAMLPTAIGFFLVHAVVGVMARRGNPYAAAILVLAAALGWIMNVDMGFALMEKSIKAGQHFVKMEMIHRTSPGEKGKEKLSTLSLYHLELGTRALIDAMSDIIALGIFIAGGKLGGKGASEISKRIKSSRGDASIEIWIEDGKISKIRTLKGQRVIETQVEVKTIKDPAGGGESETSLTPGDSPSADKKLKAGDTKQVPPGPGAQAGPGEVVVKTDTAGTADAAAGKGKKIRLVDTPPIEGAGPNLSTKQKGKIPESAKIVKVLEYSFKETDPQSRPASASEVSGMTEEHMKAARDVAKETGYVVIFRTTNPKGVGLIIKGHPPKGKDLIALNTDKLTGKVTAKTREQLSIALKSDYYILDKNGFAYNRAHQPLTGADGGPVRFDMKAKDASGNLLNNPGEVIDKATRKAFVGDYDLQDVIDPSAPGRNLAAVPEKLTGDVRNPLINRFANLFNAMLKKMGDVARIVHGADAQFMQYKHFRKNAFKSDAIGILPDGRVVYFTADGLADFYKSIGRSRLEIPENVGLEHYRKD